MSPSNDDDNDDDDGIIVDNEEQEETTSPSPRKKSRSSIDLNDDDDNGKENNGRQRGRGSKKQKSRRSTATNSSFRDAVGDSRNTNAVGKPPEAGIIVKIYAENFMCHKKMTVDLCRNVNFIYGQNGSGKVSSFGFLKRASLHITTFHFFLP